MIDINGTSNFEPENFDNSNLEKAYTCYLDNKVLIDKTTRILAILSEDDLKWSGMEFNKHHYLGKTENHAFYASEINKDSNLPPLKMELINDGRNDFRMFFENFNK